MAGTTGHFDRWAGEVTQSLGVKVVGNDPFNFIPGSHNHRAALVQVGGRQLHDPLSTRGGESASLFNDETHRVGFVQEPQLAFLILGANLSVLSLIHILAFGGVAAQADNRLEQQVHPLLLHRLANFFQQVALTRIVHILLGALAMMDMNPGAFAVARHAPG